MPILLAFLRLPHAMYPLKKSMGVKMETLSIFCYDQAQLYSLPHCTIKLYSMSADTRKV